MQVQRKEDEFKAYLDSLYVISHSKPTVSTYKTAINHFRSFLLDKYLCDEIQLKSKITNNELDVYKVSAEFLIYLDKLGISSTPIRTYLCGVKGYLRHLRIQINSDDFRVLVRVPKRVRKRKIALTREIITRLLHCSSFKLQTGVLICLSSGMRVKEFVNLRLSDIDLTSNPVKLYIRAETKGRVARETFISAEATTILKDYLRRYFGWKEGEKNENLQDVHIFGRTSEVKQTSKPVSFSEDSSKLTWQQTLHRVVKSNPELHIKNENGRNAIHFHAFRDYFRTNAGNAVGRDFAESLMGHDFYMSTYYNLSEPKKLELYLKAEPELTISDNQQVAQSFAKLSEKHDYLANKVDGLLDYFKTQGVKVPNSLLP